MPDDPIHGLTCDEMLGALNAPERRKILRLLRGGALNVTEIAEKLRLADKAVNVSHHLNVLRHAGLVRNEKQGRFVLYTLAPGVLLPDEECDVFDLGCCELKMKPGGEGPCLESPTSPHRPS